MILNFNYGDAGKIFYLVKSHICPDDGEGFKVELRDDESFQTEFIGATEQECQNWALEHQFQNLHIEQDIVVIADARSATDNTMLMQYYSRELEDLGPNEPDLEFGEYGLLPRERSTWYDFRIDYQEAFEVWSSLMFGPPDGVYPVYFGLKEDLTDERGVFNVTEATRLVRGES
jgi:hypothetical protein